VIVDRIEAAHLLRLVAKAAIGLFHRPWIDPL
jgi:hypothetical protein